jgi:very-short-patch-repair endonuclease
MPRPIKDHDLQTNRSRDLRKNSSYPERKLWSVVRDRRLAGLKFRRQVPIGQYIVDFLCVEHDLILELDGDSHNERGEYDMRRQQILESNGYRVLRISNDDALRHLDGVGDAILKACGLPLM